MLNIQLPHDPEIPPLGIYAREIKTYVLFVCLFVYMLLQKLVSECP